MNAIGLSDELRVMFRPFAAYRRLRREAPRASPIALLLRRPLFLLLALGVFVSLTSAGRLVAVHVLGTMLFWSFVPILQISIVVALTVMLARGQSIPRAVDLFFVGQGPWLLFLALLSGVCLFAPSVYEAFVWLLTSGTLPGLFVLTFLWSALLSWAFFRSGLDLGWPRALAAGFAYLVGYGGAITSYYLLTNQAQPLLLGGP